MKEIKVELNSAGILSVAITILLLAFALGFLCRSKQKEEVTFTKTEMAAVQRAMNQYGDTVTVTKDKDGNLILNVGAVND